MRRRSLLFSPGDQPELLRKAADTDADVLVFDLEDGVGPDRKDPAREAVKDVLSTPDFDPNAEVCVRINPLAAGGTADLDRVITDTSPDALMVPKVNDAADIEAVVDHLEHRGIEVPLLVLIERARAVLRAEAIAAVPAVSGVMFGAEDLASEMGVTRTTAGREVEYARQHVVLAATSAGVQAIDGVFTDFEDEAGLQEAAKLAREVGYHGKAAIHPGQVDPINAAFTPTEEAVSWAKRIVQASEEAGGGVFALDGEMIDAAIVGQAERVLERAGVGADEG